jgi:hypothetical protein
VKAASGSAFIVAVCGSRVLPAALRPHVERVTAYLLDAGAGLAVGCCVGVDECVIQASARWGFHRVTVWSAFGPVSPVLAPPPRHYIAAGSWPGSALAAVAQHRQRGGLVMPWAGGGPHLPLKVRLANRTRTVIADATASAVVLFSSPRSHGSALACRLALARGLPVFAFPLGFSGSLLPALGPGAWQAMAGPGCWAQAWRWVPAQIFHPVLRHSEVIP